MPSHNLFFMGLAFILVHEMDAIRAHEWRIFPLTSRLDDTWGYLVFTAAHIPLYLLLFLGLWSNNGLNEAVIFGLDMFFIIHVGLHLLYRKHPKNEFTSLFSWAVILGAGLSGLVDWVIHFVL